MIVLLLVAAAGAARPRVGVVSIHLSKAKRDSLSDFFRSHHANPRDFTFIPHNYARFVTDAGGEPFPLPISAPDEELRRLMNRLDAVLLTGGGPPFSFREKRLRPLSRAHVRPHPNEPYFTKIRVILAHAIAINRRRRFPVFGICLGFEAILMHFSDFAVPFTLIHQTDASDAVHAVPSPSRFFQFYRQAPRNNASSGEMLFNNIYGVSVADFQATPSLLAELVVPMVFAPLFVPHLFVAAVEHRALPLFAVQFHPEKVLYESDSKWNAEAGESSTETARLFLEWLRRILGPDSTTLPQPYDPPDLGWQFFDTPLLPRTWIVGPTALVSQLSKWASPGIGASAHLSRLFTYD